MKTSVSQAVQYAVSFGASALIGLACLFYLMNKLPPDEFALIGITLGLVMVAELFVGVEAYTLVPINLLQKTSPEFYEFLYAFNKLAIANSILIFLVCFILGFAFSEYKWPLIYAGSYCLLRYFIKNITSILVQKKLSKEFSLFYFFNTSLANLFTVVCIEIVASSWHMRIISMLLSDLIFVLIFRGTIAIVPHESTCKDEYRAILSFGIPLIPAALAFWSINQLDRYIAAHYFSLEIVGFYVAAYNLGKTIDIPVRIFNTIFRPKLFDALKASRELNTYKSVLMVYAAFLVPSSFLLYLIVDFVAPFILPKGYELAITLMPITLAFFCSLGFWRLSISILEFHRKTKITALIAIFCSLINIVLSLLMIEFIGYYGPLIASSFSMALACFMAVLLTYKMREIYY